MLAGCDLSYDASRKPIGGWIHRTDRGLKADGQTAWPRSRPRIGWVSSISFDPFDAKVAYATYSSFDDTDNRGHVWKTGDMGEHWAPIDGTGGQALPDIPVHTLIADPTLQGRIYVGTDLGVFTSLQGGSSWKQENTGFPRVPTSSLVVNAARPRCLFAFTHGRGVWAVQLQ